MKSPTTLLAALAASHLGALAHATTEAEPHSLTVRFNDLDTNSAPGAMLLYRRIKAAAENVCSDLGAGRSLTLLPRYKDCVHRAMAVAVGKVDRPAVTDYAIARGVIPIYPVALVNYCNQDGCRR